MAKPKKFGAFAGVFTPSILTILGVIMYMRLGWVVGEAGLYTALAIVLISHIISVSTGLSISSIATDKKVKIGGIYYMLSRSLGLPMGGAIGIALFVGTALSISLYIVGFAENFLSISAIQEFTGLGNTVNDYRILGTIVIVVLVILAFISTSLAIKTQFFVLSFIVLSLISVFVGFFVHPGFITESIAFSPVEGGKSAEYVFGIFFPAVTGFTAGVAMSGDLKDPRRDIPLGTMASIGVGLVVYIGLTISFAVFVDRDILINDKNFLLKIAWWSPLVIAGVWGATLSSALGGILGGPRILQAIARDKIMPRFVAKGYGASNEPRNALIVIFLIAEMGILIGELDVIARLVSMFYLASYGFINLAYSLESWASTDFRPSFKIPNIVGLIGFAACFIVMFRIDMLAMLAAMLLMGGIYFLLKRKQLKLDYGDVWLSVWYSVIRTALHRMDKREIEERNWQPNIILFSGGSKRRPYLINFGKALVGRYGLLSNFDLHENKDASILFSKDEQSFSQNKEEAGIFTRRQSCRDIYEGIETISQIYGFSGVEPNTVLMGWARDTKNPVRFVKMINRLSDLDLNICLMDYDKRYGFGNYKQIDIWWRGAGHNGNLALTLSKFIWSSPQWREARVRLMVVNPNNDESPKIRRKAGQIFESLRINADIKIINNEIEQKTFYEIIRVESVNTDLIFLGIPPKIDAGREKEFVENTNRLLKDIGTVMLVKASSKFKNMRIGASLELTEIKPPRPKGIQTAIKEKLDIPKISYPRNERLAKEIDQLLQRLNRINTNFHQNNLLNIVGHYKNLATEVKELSDKFFDNAQAVLNVNDTDSRQKMISKLHANFLIKSRKLVEDFKNEQLETQQHILERGIVYFLEEINRLMLDLPQKVPASFHASELKPLQTDSTRLRYIKLQNRLKIRLIPAGRGANYKVNYQRLVQKQLLSEILKIFYLALNKWGIATFQFVVEFQKFTKETRNSFLLLETQATKSELTLESIEKEQERLAKIYEKLTTLFSESQQALYNFLSTKAAQIVEKVSHNVKKIDANSIARKTRQNKKILRQIDQELRRVPELSHRNQGLLFNAVELEVMLFWFENKLRKIFFDTSVEISQAVEKSVLSQLFNLKEYLEKYVGTLEKSGEAKFSPPQSQKYFLSENNHVYFNEIAQATFENIKRTVSKFPNEVEIMSEAAQNNFGSVQFEQIGVVSIAASRLLDYLVQDEIIEHLQAIADEVPEKVLRLNSSTNDMMRLLEFSVGENLQSSPAELDVPNSLQSDDSPENVLKFVKEQKRKIESQIRLSQKYKNYVLLQIQERLNATFEKLSLYSFTRMAQNIKQYIKEQESKKRFGFWKRRIAKIKKFFRHQIDQLWYRQSKALLLARQMGQSENQSHTGVNDMLNLLEEVSISTPVLNKLPFYYRQLFLRKNNYYQEFWFGRKTELHEAEKAVSRYQAGFLGGLLISGQQESGKTFLSQYIASHFFENAEVYLLSPPEAGSISPKLFKESLQSTLGVSGSYAQMFKRLPRPSVLIIDDMELWWEKSKNGFKVIETIVSLIENYSRRCFFLVNANTHALRLMNMIKPIDRYFLNSVECQPFDAEMLKEIILFRHKSSGIKFQLGKKKQENMHSSDYASLFSKYFSYSQGNVGVALQSWIANITHFGASRITIKAPRVPDLSRLDYLHTKTYAIMVQFVLHKRLNIERLKRITLKDEQSLKNHLSFLQRAGVIIESNGVYELNKFLHIHIKTKLMEKGIL